MKGSKDHHSASHQGQKSKHFCTLHLGIRGAEETMQLGTGWNNITYMEKRQSKIRPNSGHWSPKAGSQSKAVGLHTPTVESEILKSGGEPEGH